MLYICLEICLEKVQFRFYWFFLGRSDKIDLIYHYQDKWGDQILSGSFLAMVKETKAKESPWRAELSCFGKY